MVCKPEVGLRSMDEARWPRIAVLTEMIPLMGAASFVRTSLLQTSLIQTPFVRIVRLGWSFDRT